MGDLKVFYDEKGVTSVILPCDRDRDRNLEGLEYKEDEKVKKYFDDYFSGKELGKLELNIKITEFQKKVFDLLLETKTGTLLTYGDIAKLINCGSYQAIGQALKRNPVPVIIPCHRVVGKGWDGGFGGSTTGEKMDFKKYLINHERK